MKSCNHPALGVTVCVASGDSGSSDGAAGGQDTVPGLQPVCARVWRHAIAGDEEHQQRSRGTTAGWRTGGGVSAVLALPVWQKA